MNRVEETSVDTKSDKTTTGMLVSNEEGPVVTKTTVPGVGGMTYPGHLRRRRPKERVSKITPNGEELPTFPTTSTVR